VRHVVRQVKEERPVAVLAHEADRFFGVAAGERVQVGRVLDRLAVPHQHGHEPGEVGLAGEAVVDRRAEPVIEALGIRHQLRVVRPAPPVARAAKVPLAHQRGGVSPALQDFGKCDFVGMEDGVAVLAVVDLGHADRVASGEQGRPRHAADRLHVEVRKPHPLRGHAVEVRCLDERRAVAADVVVSQVVGEEDDEVRGALWLLGCIQGPRQDDTYQGQGAERCPARKGRRK